MRRRRAIFRSIAIPALAIAALGGILALDGGDDDADLVVVHRVDVFTLDPQRMSYQQDMRVAMALYEPLCVLDTETAEPIPGAAASWSLAEDGVTWTFAIRPEARWSNGDPLGAADFIAAWKRALLPDLATDYSGLFFLIDGAEPFFAWRTEALARFAAGDRDEAADAEALWRLTEDRFAAEVGLAAPDERTLVVRLRSATAYFLDLASLPVFSPVHRPTLEAFTSIDPESGRIRIDHGWTRPGTLVSNGPYVLERWRYKRDLRLRRNPLHWNADAVRAESIAILPLEDANTAVLAFDAGGIDWVTDVVVEYRADLLEQRRRYEERHAALISELRSAGLEGDDLLAALPPPDRRRGERRTIHAFDAFGTDFFSFNCRPQLADGRPNPFADPAVRRAFAMAVDKQVLVEQVTRLRERISGSIVPQGSIPGYEPPQGLPFDPERARRELAGAGWTDRDGDGRLEDAEGRRFPTVDLLYSTGNARYQDLALAIRDMWQRLLGVSVELRAKEGKFYKDDLKRGNFMVARGGWYGDFGDPTTFLLLSRTGDGNNDRGFSSPRFDALLDEAERERDPARRFRILEEAERIIVEEELPMLPLCTYRTLYLYEPGALRGLMTLPRLEQYLGRIHRER
ncbi:MAG TPA: peptide ABC transporter substrate-binding protein [Phycisphaerales bacterium]|nr:peptide ABC transporter substrate-binding protein [Phycisphaerales bacterium]HMP36091.1 peptide ABC transporter substrate-binding protein [Phycisphaerales bacterium]